MIQVQSLMTNAERYSLSAAVFTALTDVEMEIDGLMSYDRAVVKIGSQALHQIHSQLLNASNTLNQGPSGEISTPVNLDSCFSFLLMGFSEFCPVARISLLS